MSASSCGHCGGSYIRYNFSLLAVLVSKYIDNLIYKTMKTVYIERNKLFKNITLLLCNSIIEADENFIEDNYDIFFYDCEECSGIGEKDGKTCEECNGDGKHESEIYQFYLCGLDDWEKARLAEYGVEVGYSGLLDLHVLPIYDFGTSWSAFSYSKEVPDDYQLASDETLTRNTVY